MSVLLSQRAEARSFCCLSFLFRPTVLALVMAATFVQLFYSFNDSVIKDEILLESIQIDGHRRMEHCGNSQEAIHALDDESRNAERGSVIMQRVDALRILEKFANVSISSLSTDTIRELPTKEQWENLYGEGIVMIGEESSCSRYRQQVPLKRRFAGPAGMFNTGTNMFHQLTKVNLVNKARDWDSGIFQVPWGKHRPATDRGLNAPLKFRVYNYTEILPVVIIRDPLNFLHSLCSAAYQTRFLHNKRHCPNLVPNDNDRKAFGKKIPEVFKVNVKYSENQTVDHDSLIHFWNDWYRDYVKIPDYPILYIRMEDLLMYPDQVLSRLAKCMGISVRQPLKLKSDAVKKHGSGTDLIGALSKTASKSRRVSNMTKDDLNYVREHVARDLIDMFHYNVPEEGAIVA